MKPARRVVARTAFLALASWTVLLTPRPAAAQARWMEMAPPVASGNSVAFDTQRNRALVSGSQCLWAVSGDPIPVWSKIWEGTPPFGRYVYQPQADRLWAFSQSQGVSVPGELWSMDLGTLPLTWVQQTFTGTAPRLTGHAQVFDPIRQRVIVFGGNTGCLACETNNVSILTLTGTPSWSAAGVSGTPPTRRSQAAGVYDPVRDRIIFYGGLIFGPTYYDEAWALSMSPPMTWTFMTPEYYVALARANTIAVLDSVGQRMIVTGGDNASNGYNDTWALDLSLAVPADSARWTPVADDAHPPLRSSAIGWVDPSVSRMFRYGGGLGAPRIDLWALTLDATPAWSAVRPDSVPPPYRMGHVAFMDPAAQRWTVALGSPSESWSRMEGVEQPWTLGPSGGPSDRFWAGAVTDAPGSRALVFGGSTTQNSDGAGIEFADLWSYGFGGGAWSMLSPPSTPTTRADALVVMDTARRRIIVHGGRFTAPGTPVAKVRPRTDTWAYDVAANTWSTLAAGSFGGRWGEVGIYDPVRDRVIAFGGMDTLVTFADVHAVSLAGGTWSALATSGTPPPIGQRRSLRAAYDAAGDRMIVLASDGTNLSVYALTLGATPTWSVVPVSGGPPRRRESYAFASDPSGTRLIVAQGQTSNNGGTNYTEVWELYFDATTSVSASLLSIDAAPDLVRIAWQLPPGVASPTLYRRAAGGEWSRRADLVLDAFDRVRAEDRDVAAGDTYEYRLGVRVQGVERFLGEITVTVPRAPLLSLVGARPNPVAGPMRVSFSLAGREPARLELLDVAGRRIDAREIGALGPGSHTLVWSPPDRGIESGLYFLRLTQGGETRMARVAILR